MDAKQIVDLANAVIKYLSTPGVGTFVTLALLIAAALLGWLDHELRKVNPDRFRLTGQATVTRLKFAIAGHDWKIMTHEHARTTSDLLRSALGLSGAGAAYYRGRYHIRLVIYTLLVVAPALAFAYSVDYVRAGLYQMPVIRSNLESFLFSHTVSYIGANYLSLMASIAATLYFLGVVERHSYPVIYLIVGLLDALVALFLIYVAWVAASALTDGIWIAIMSEYDLQSSFPVRNYFEDIYIQLFSLSHGGIAGLVIVYSAALPTLLHLVMSLMFLVTIYLPDRAKDVVLGAVGLFHSDEKSVLRTVSGVLLLLSSLVGAAVAYLGANAAPASSSP